MGDGVGLILGLGIDPSGAKPGLAQFEEEFNASYSRTNEAFLNSLDEMEQPLDQLDKSLLSNRQTVMLLNQELGIHMPRAMSGAVAKMLPDIAALGAGLMGIWAVEKVYDWAKVINEQFFQIYTHGDEVIKDLDAAAAAAFKHAGQEATEMFTHFKTSLAGTFDIAEIDARAKQLERFHAAYQSLVGKMGTDLAQAIAKVAPTLAEAQAEGLTKLEEVDKKINELGQLQFQAHERMAEVQAKEAKEAAEELKRQAKEAAEAAKQQGDAEYRAAMQKYEGNQRAFHASEEALRHEMALQDRLGREAVEQARRQEEAKEREARAIHHLTEELQREREQQTRAGEELGKETARQIADIERIGNEQERSMLRGRAEARQRIEEQHNEAVAAIQAANEQAQAIARLTGDYKAMAEAAKAAYDAMIQANANYLKQLHEQEVAEKQCVQAEIDRAEAKIQTSAAEIATFVGAIAGRKAQAEVEGYFYLAEGSFDFARGIFPPNPALITRGLGEIGAGIDMLKVAGKSGRTPSIGGGGGGGGYGEERYGGRAERGGGYGGGGEYGERELAGTGLAPGAQNAPSGRVTVHVMPEGEHSAFIAAAVQSAYARGYYIPATVAGRSAPAQG
jgi:hypothetical protein